MFHYLDAKCEPSFKTSFSLNCKGGDLSWIYNETFEGNHLVAFPCTLLLPFIIHEERFVWAHLKLLTHEIDNPFPETNVRKWESILSLFHSINYRKNFGARSEVYSWFKLGQNQCPRQKSFKKKTMLNRRRKLAPSWNYKWVYKFKKKVIMMTNWCPNYKWCHIRSWFQISSSKFENFNLTRKKFTISNIRLFKDIEFKRFCCELSKNLSF